MTILAIALSAILLVLAAIHLLWGIGYWFPIRDEAALVRAVIGLRGAERMPGPIPCAAVTLALLAVLMAIWWPPIPLRQFIWIMAAVVFVGRGALAYVGPWRKLAPQEPFATYDRRYYGPLCLGLGLGLAALLIGDFG